MTIHFKMLGTLHETVLRDLRRPHSHAAERVGFLSCRFGASEKSLLVLAHRFHPVLDADYEDDFSVGARINSSAFRSALQTALSEDVGMFHVHLHGHHGVPRPSRIDWREWARFVPNFWHVRPNLPHGALLLSADRLAGWCWYPGSQEPIPLDRFTVIGRNWQTLEVRDDLL